jgi:3-deoxy-D-manno-octulosonic-acid transferase
LRVVRFVYNLVLAALFPVAVLYLAYRLVVVGKSRGGFRERLGIIPEALAAAVRKGPGERLVWVHAVSVGEFGVAQTVIRELRARAPHLKVAVSVTTETGWGVASNGLPEGTPLFHMPFDLPFCVNATLRAVDPDALVLVETELWPTLLDRAHARGVACMVANGRLSDRSYRPGLRVWPLYAWVMSCVDQFTVQTAVDAERFITLGADSARVRMTGNAKFDESYPDVPEEARAALRAEYGIAPGAPVVIYGSTGPGEDAALLDAYQALRLSLPSVRLIHAPRHPERGPEVAALVGERGFAAVRRSRMLAGADSPVGRDCVIVLDTVGELARLYAIADVAFVGRSLVPLGGGNILQPLAYGKPVVVGPHTANFRETVRQAGEAGLCTVVGDAAALADELERLLGSAEARSRVAETATRVFEENRGAAGRIVDVILALLDEEPTTGA